MVRRTACIPVLALVAGLAFTHVDASPTPATIHHDRVHSLDAVEFHAVPNVLGTPVGLTSASAEVGVEGSEPQVWRVSLSSAPSQRSHVDPTIPGRPREARSSSDERGTRILRAARKLDLDVWKATKEYIDIFFEDEGMMTTLLNEVESEGEERVQMGSSGPEEEMDITWSPLFTTHSLQPHLSLSSSTLPPLLTPLNLSSLLSPFHTAYHPLGPTNPDESSIYGFLEALQERWPDRCEVFGLGKSAEGREIRGVKIHVVEEPQEGDDDDEFSTILSWVHAGITTHVGPVWSSILAPFGSSRTTNKRSGHHAARRPRSQKPKRPKKPKHPKRPEQPPPVPPNPNPPEGRKGKELFLMGGQHAREWVSPATILYFAHFLLLESESDEEVLELLKEFTFTLVPTINPDGYVYSRDHSRLWKKNRQEVGSKTCKGIDMNSNWGYQWDNDARTSVKSNPCSENYPGEHAFEAVEAQVVADYLQNTTMNVRAFVDLHSYGQLFMFPYSYSCEDFPKDAETLMEAGLGVAKALKADAGTQYKVGEACDLVYRMAGDAIDWAYGRAGIRFAYSAELRDTGTYGFLLPPHLIRATASELTSGLVYLAKFIKSNEAAA